MCDGKKRYETRMKAIHYALKSSKMNGHGIRVYECPICKGFHLTTRSEDGQSMKYDFEIAQKAVLNFAENDTREYATFPAVGVIVREIRNQQYLEAKPIKEVIRAISYGKGYEDISDDAKRIISKEVYNKWLKVDAEEFAAKSEFFAKMLSTGHTLMLD